MNTLAPLWSVLFTPPYPKPHTHTHTLICALTLLTHHLSLYLFLIHTLMHRLSIAISRYHCLPLSYYITFTTSLIPVEFTNSCTCSFCHYCKIPPIQCILSFMLMSQHMHTKVFSQSTSWICITEQIEVYHMGLCRSENIVLNDNRRCRLCNSQSVIVSSWCKWSCA